MTRKTVFYCGIGSLKDVQERIWKKSKLENFAIYALKALNNGDKGELIYNHRFQMSPTPLGMGRVEFDWLTCSHSIRLSSLPTSFIVFYHGGRL